MSTMTVGAVPIDLTAGMPEAADDQIVVRLAHVADPGEVRDVLAAEVQRHRVTDRLLVAVDRLTGADLAALELARRCAVRIYRAPEPRTATWFARSALGGGWLAATEFGHAVLAAVRTLDSGQSLLILVPPAAAAPAVAALVRQGLGRRLGDLVPGDGGGRTLPHPWCG